MLIFSPLKDWIDRRAERYVSFLMVPDVLQHSLGQFTNQAEVRGKVGVSAGQFGHLGDGGAQDVRHLGGVLPRDAGQCGAVFCSGVACVGEQGNDIFSGVRVVGGHVQSFPVAPLNFAQKSGRGPLQSKHTNVRGQGHA